MDGFTKIRTYLEPEEIRTVHGVAARKRRLQGKHLVRVMVSSQEKDELLEISRSSGLTEAQVLLATSFLFFRTKPESNPS